MDYPAMDKCPIGKRGRHELNAVLPDDADKDMTLFCAHCGALRRVPVTGALFASRLDDLTPAEIERAVTG